MKKNKKLEDNNFKNISSNKIIIKVYKDFGSNIGILKADYEAEERRDAYNNLVSINKEFLHDEDIDFSIDDVYHNMQVVLEFKNKTKEEKVKLLEEKIIYQEKLIQFLDKFPEINSIFNYSDENLKLHDYKLLKDYSGNINGSGAYFTIEKGKRIYSFDSVDGFLIPIWRGISSHTQYPDHTRKKKIIIQEDIILKNELQKYDINKKVGNLIIWGLICISILFALNLWGGLRILQMQGDITTEAHADALKCVEYTSNINKLYAEAAANKLFEKDDPAIQTRIKDISPKEIS